MAYCSNLSFFGLCSSSNFLMKHYVSDAGSASVFKYREVPNLLFVCCLFVFLALQSIVVVFSQPDSGL